MNMVVRQEITEILNMPKGASITYHVGFLATDRGGEKDKSAEEQAVDDAGKIARRLMDLGKVALCQRRLGPSQFQYIAQRI